MVFSNIPHNLTPPRCQQVMEVARPTGSLRQQREMCCLLNRWVIVKCCAVVYKVFGFVQLLFISTLFKRVESHVTWIFHFHLKIVSYFQHCWKWLNQQTVERWFISFTVKGRVFKPVEIDKRAFVFHQPSNGEIMSSGHAAETQRNQEVWPLLLVRNLLFLKYFLPRLQ